MKTCSDCNKELPLSFFVPKASCKDGYEPRCRQCRSIKYNKSTPELLCKKLYNSQRTNSIKRGHPAPTYSLDELTTWALNQQSFMLMFHAWRDAGYPKNLAPSIDRIDDNLPYVIENLQLLTWDENRAKAGKSRIKNTLLVNQRPVVAYQKDGSLYKEYASMAEAMREFGGKATQSWGISSVCNGVPVKDGKGRLYVPKTYKGLIWNWND